MISNIIQESINYSFAPAQKANELRDDSVQENSWTKGLGARALYLVQIIVSIVAIPLFLLATIFGPAIALCTEGKEAAWELLKGTALFELAHLCAPFTCLISAFAPHSWKNSQPTDAVFDCLDSLVRPNLR